MRRTYLASCLTRPTPSTCVPTLSRTALTGWPSRSHSWTLPWRKVGQRLEVWGQGAASHYSLLKWCQSCVFYIFVWSFPVAWQGFSAIIFENRWDQPTVCYLDELFLISTKCLLFLKVFVFSFFHFFLFPIDHSSFVFASSLCAQFPCKTSTWGKPSRALPLRTSRWCPRAVCPIPSERCTTWVTSLLHSTSSHRTGWCCWCIHTHKTLRPAACSFCIIT